jgi:hypothetical protein
LEGLDMARIRTIKPDFWSDETLTECSLSARLLFIGTWNFADDKGNLEHSWKQLKMKVFPADDVKVLGLVNELIAHGLLIEYSVSDKKYLHIKGFEKHQVINRPSVSNIPEFDESLITHGGLTEDSLREGKGREGKGIGKENPSAFALPDWVDSKAWAGFVAMRKAIKKPLADTAVPLALAKLAKLKAAGNDPNEVLEQSTMNSWQGLFEVKQPGGGNGKFDPIRAGRELHQQHLAEELAAKNVGGGVVPPPKPGLPAKVHGVVPGKDIY